MSFNVRANNIMDWFDSWTNRKSLVFDVIEDHAPDIFALQEPLQNQLDNLQRGFPQYACYYAGGVDGKTKGQACPIFFRSDRFELLDSGTFWYSDTPNKPGSKSWGNIVPRFCSWVQLVEKGQTASFYIYNTHLDSISQNSREKSVRLLARRIDARKSSEPYIITGDFNMKLKNPAMAFLQQFGLIDVWRLIHPDKPDVSTCNFGTWAKGPQLDHIQLSPDAKAIEALIDDRKINGHYPSDHFPVIAKIELPARVTKSAPLVAKAGHTP